MSNPHYLNQENRGVFMAHKHIRGSSKLNVFMQGQPYPFNNLTHSMILHLQYLINTSFNHYPILTHKVTDCESVLKSILLAHGVILNSASILSTNCPLELRPRLLVTALSKALNHNLGTKDLLERVKKNQRENEGHNLENKLLILHPISDLSFLDFKRAEIKTDHDVNIYWNYHIPYLMDEIENPTDNTMVIVDTTYNTKEWDEANQYQNIDELIPKGYIVSGRTLPDDDPTPTTANQAQIDDVFNGYLNYITQRKLERVESNLKTILGFADKDSSEQETKEPNLFGEQPL